MGDARVSVWSVSPLNILLFHHQEDGENAGERTTGLCAGD